MQKRSKLDAVNLRQLSPGEWVWERGIGYRRNMTGETGTWYIKYRAPVPGRFREGVRPPVQSVKERIPNCKNRSQAEGVLMARKGAVFEWLPAEMGREVLLDLLAIFFDGSQTAFRLKKAERELCDGGRGNLAPRPIRAIEDRSLSCHQDAFGL